MGSRGWSCRLHHADICQREERDDAMPSAVDFRTELRAQLGSAASLGWRHVEVNSGELHRIVGGYPGSDHRMPICCSVMEAEMRGGDEIVTAPPKGKGASLTIRYKLPRR
jgi:hypothetical protein